MRKAFAACALAAASVGAQSRADWWLGFIDARDRAFLEIPIAAGCPERDALVKRSGAQPGQVVTSRRRVAEFIAAGERLTFVVADAAASRGERVMTGVVAIVREDEGARGLLAPSCWYLAEAGTQVHAYMAREDRVAVGVHPPRALHLRIFEQTWQAFQGRPRHVSPTESEATDGQAPFWIAERINEWLPDASQIHVQPFNATLDPARGPEPMWLIGATARGDAAASAPGTFNTVNAIVRPGAAAAPQAPLYRAGPSGGLTFDRAGSFVAQIVAAVDLDGDGIEELLVRARYYAGGNLKVLRWNGHSYGVVREGGYEGE